MRWVLIVLGIVGIALQLGSPAPAAGGPLQAKSVGSREYKLCCAYAMKRNIDDVGFIRALIDDQVRSGRVGSRRIYVVGMSNGGMMAQRIAIALGDRIAGAAVFVGALCHSPARCCASRSSRRTGGDRPASARSPSPFRRFAPPSLSRWEREGARDA